MRYWLSLVGTLIQLVRMVDASSMAAGVIMLVTKAQKYALFSEFWSGYFLLRDRINAVLPFWFMERKPSARSLFWDGAIT